MFVLFSFFVLFICHTGYSISGQLWGLLFLLHSAEMMIANRFWKSVVLNYVSVIRQITVLWQSEKFVYLSVWWS